MQVSHRYGLFRDDDITWLHEPSGWTCITPGYPAALPPPFQPEVPKRLVGRCAHQFALAGERAVMIPQHPLLEIAAPGAPATLEARLDEAATSTVHELLALYGSAPSGPPMLVTWADGRLNRHVELLRETNAAPLFIWHRDDDRQDIVRFRALPRARPLIWIGPALFGIPLIDHAGLRGQSYDWPSIARAVLWNLIKTQI